METWNTPTIFAGECDFVANSVVGSLFPRDRLTICCCVGICRNSGERTSLGEDSADQRHHQNEKGPQRQIELHSSWFRTENRKIHGRKVNHVVPVSVKERKRQNLSSSQHSVWGYLSWNPISPLTTSLSSFAFVGFISALFLNTFVRWIIFDDLIVSKCTTAVVHSKHCIRTGNQNPNKFDNLTESLVRRWNHLPG